MSHAGLGATSHIGTGITESRPRPSGEAAGLGSVNRTGT